MYLFPCLQKNSDSPETTSLLEYNLGYSQYCLVCLCSHYWLAASSCQSPCGWTFFSFGLKLGRDDIGQAGSIQISCQFWVTPQIQPWLNYCCRIVRTVNSQYFSINLFNNILFLTKIPQIVDLMSVLKCQYNSWLCSRRNCGTRTKFVWDNVEHISDTQGPTILMSI